MNKKLALVVGTVVVSLVAGALPATAGGKGRTKERNKNASVPAPVNDSFATGTEIVELPFETATDMTAASVEVDEPQPSCSAAKATVWYKVAIASEQNLVAQAASQFPNAIAVYSGESLTTLSEVACAAEGSTDLMWPASAGAIYFVQVAAPRGHKGVVNFGIEVDTWKSKLLYEDQHVVNVPAIDRAAVVIEGKPRASDPNIYDVTVTAADTTVGPFGVETDPVVLPAIRQELVKVPGQQIDVKLSSSYRYDSAQRKCLLYQGEDCASSLPVGSDTSWYTGDSGKQAELVVTVRIVANGTLLAERTVSVPFAGQAGGLLP
jgi:hypothetical protein